ncbi:hypothetical protein [Ruegeria arenilitoris]|uniref:hypothetical protein n=1 Tax=Ruegeria arenilitoris TaxID=1173585 RepID=UPI00147C7A17|nr:hypothetical protein [Ruegeria arenilitoris]
MVQNNKVLTVSYGTFSCTLEGFDDSFETMKAIAEYFRDLAADDRYFGSEPPQPDAEMLTRIAQRDASRRVEAKQNDTGLLLRATDEAHDAAPQQPAPAASTPAPASPDLSVVDTAPAAGAAPFFADAEPVESAAPQSADSIAAKLQRIRAVVSHNDQTPPAYSEDEDSGFLASPEPQIDAISAAFEAGALSPEDLGATEEVMQEDAPVEATQQPTDPFVDLAEEEPQAAVEFEAEEEFSAASEVEAEADEGAEDAPEVEADLEEAEEAAAEETSEDDQAASDEEASSEILFADLEEDTDSEPEADDILNILGDQPEDADEEVSELAEDGVLTAEDEESILGEISEIEAEMDARSKRDANKPQDVDSDVLRLMEKADAQMDDPATSDKRETYSHLRTAVAATEAEGGKARDADEDENQKYRGDLASVVSPRRPEIHVTSMRPESDTAAPLKLVAEQRIDTQDADAGPVTPRRVTAAQDDDASEEGGFAHFAQEQGAQSLPDLLEAAAAYLSFIEGQEQFSRPQLMNKVRSLKQDEFNREESLRSFGQLLRDGKIEKAGGGRFAASNQIGFRPDDKRAAG